MPTVNTPLDSLKNAVLRATHGMDGATDSIAGSMCDHDHENELEWFDSIKLELWRALAEHIPGIVIKDGLVMMTREAKWAVHTYDDGSQVSIHIDLGGFVADYYPRFDGPHPEFLERLTKHFLEHRAESIAYEAAHPAPTDRGDFQ